MKELKRYKVDVMKEDLEDENFAKHFEDILNS